MTTIANRYAKALHQAAAAEGALPAVLEAAATLADAVSDPATQAAMANPALGPARRVQLAETLARAVSAPAPLAGLLSVMAKNNRFAQLANVLKALEEAVAAEEGRVTVRLETAQPLTDAQRTSLKAQVKVYVHAKDVVLQETVVPGLLGGFRAFFGGRLWDASVRGGFTRLSGRLQTTVTKSNQVS